MTHNDTLPAFKIVGISARTTNADGRAVLDLGELWARFYAQQNASKIPNKIGDDVYAVYTDYKLDHEGAYTTIIGCKVASFDSIPEGMTGKEIGGGLYKRFTARGKMPHAVVRQWQEIWNDPDLRRAYSADFEVYGAKSRDDTHAEVDIFIAVK